MSETLKLSRLDELLNFIEVESPAQMQTANTAFNANQPRDPAPMTAREVTNDPPTIRKIAGVMGIVFVAVVIFTPITLGLYFAGIPLLIGALIAVIFTSFFVLSATEQARQFIYETVDE